MNYNIGDSVISKGTGRTGTVVMVEKSNGAKVATLYLVEFPPTTNEYGRERWYEAKNLKPAREATHA